MSIKKGRIEMFKKIACYSAALILVLTSFVLPSFANDYNYSFVGQPLPIGDLNSSPSDGFLVYRESPQSSSTYVRTAYSSSSDTFVFHVSNIQYGNSTIPNGYVFASPSLNTVVSSFNYYYDNGNVLDIRTSQLNLVDSDTGLYFYVYNISYGNSENLPSYTSLEDGFNAVNDFINNSVSNYSDTITINPGQVAYIGFPASAEYSLDVTTTMPKLSSGGGWSDSPQRWGATAELPSSGTSFPVSGSYQIPWQVVGSTNIFGQGVSGEWSVSNTLPVGYRFIYIYNPWYYQQSISSPSIYSSDGNLTINTNPITVTVEGYSAIRIFNLQQSVTGEGIYVSNSLSDFSDYTEVVPSSESGSGEVEYQTFVNGESSGDPSIINGTNNNQYNPNPMTVTEHIQQVTQVLSNFANSLIELIKAPISHVANLIQAGTGFMGSLRGLYAWLPVDIQGLVTSALTLVIGIGVFKVFL